MKRILMLITAFLILSAPFLILSTSSSSAAQITSETDPPIVVPPRSPLKVDLQISQKSNIIIEIICTISVTNFDAPDTKGEIILPDGFSLIDGNLSWTCNLVEHEYTQQMATAEAVKDGLWTITAKANCTLTSGDWFGNVDYAYVSVSDQSIDSISKSLPSETRGSAYCEKLSDPPPLYNETQGVECIEPKAVSPTGLYVSKQQASAEPSSPGELTITGRWWYWDNNENLRPLAWATVWIYDDETLWLDYKGSTLTDINGYFTFGPIGNDDGLFEDGMDIVVCVVAWTSAAKVISSGGSVYDGWTGTFWDCPDGTLDIGDWTVPHDERGAWMIFSYHCGLTAGWNYLRNLGPDYDTPMATARWPHEDWPHYHLGGEIHLPDFDAARSPDIILHEYAHHVMWNVYDGYWPPNTEGEHYINAHSNANVAWTEGWANFFPLVVQHDPWFTYVNQYNINLETPTWDTPNWDNGDDVEGRVTGALWDIFDSSNDGHDVFSNGFLNIWDVVHGQTDDTFAQFWDAWRARGHNIPYAIYAIYQNTIIYFGALDHITISPSSALIEVGESTTFSAQGYDSDNIPVVDLVYLWSVTGGIGYVNPTSTPDTDGPGQSTTFYATATGSGTVTAHGFYVNGRTGSASLTVFLPPVQEHRYWVMEGITNTCGDAEGLLEALIGGAWNWDIPFHTRPPYLTPLLMNRNITFSDPDPVTGVVYLTVPASTYAGLEHAWYQSSPFPRWFRTIVYMNEDGYGWLFTGTGTSPVLGDVDCYTFSDNTGVYWGPESPKAGELAASTGELPPVGADGVPGTGDDGFGDGTTDPVGSSILFLPTGLYLEYHDGDDWVPLFAEPWPQILTTGTAYSVVDEPTSEINGATSTRQGQPWEFLAGLDHPGDDGVPHTGDPNEYEVPYGHPQSNAYVTYACVWSFLEMETPLGKLDMLYEVVERIVRDDCVIADITGDEKVTIKDTGRCAVAFGYEDEGPGPDGEYYTEDDKIAADINFDAGADLMKPRGKINIKDIGRIVIDMGAKLTPEGIIRP